MAVPTQPTYAASVVSAANTNLLSLIDGGSGPGTLKFRDAGDALLATVTLTDPAGSVDGTTGVLTLTGAGSALPSSDGVAAYAELCDSDGAVYASIPCTESATAVRGFVALNTPTLVAGEPLSIASFTVG